MKRIHTLAAAVVTLLVVTPASFAASDPSCTIPPSGAMATDTSSGGTFDTVYVPMWAYSEEAVLDFWDGLQCQADDWDDGWGFDDVSNVNLGLARLFNGAQVVWRVHQYTKHQGFGLWRAVQIYNWQTHAWESTTWPSGAWWDFVAGYGADEWTPGCENSNGEHYIGVDEYNVLHLGGAYRSSAAQRASTLVHETVHQGIGHVDDEDCDPDSGSCDDVYGHYNSNTMQLNFLHDALVSYETAVVNNQVLRQVTAVGDQCQWIPRFAANELSQIASRASVSMGRFAVNAWPGWMTSLQNQVAAKQAQGVWSCPQCNLSDWTFLPDVCDQTACNELLNPQNVTVNDHNRQECLAYNTAVVQPGAGPETVAEAQNEFTISKLPCRAAEETAARAYCDAEKQTAQYAWQVDGCGWLDDYQSADLSSLQCVQEWCHETFEATGGWGVNGQDYQCFDEICGGAEECGGDSFECMEWFVAVHGDPALYDPPCLQNKCKGALVQCLKTQHAAGTWSYGDPLPAGCVFAQNLCESVSRFALEAFIDQRPFLDPGPMRSLIEGVLTHNPGKNVYQFADSIRQASAARVDDATLNAMAVKLTSSGEMISALYHAAPAQFAWLYGQDGFLEILGPGIANVTPEPITPDLLGPGGQAALAEFQRLLAAQPGGRFEGAIGTFTGESAASGR